MIELKNVTLKISSKIIFENLNALISPGEFIGIFGANGSGKTTFLRTLLGLLKPAQGQIFIQDKLAHKAHANIGYIPQLRERLAPGFLSAREYLSCTLKGNYSKAQQEKMREIIYLVQAETYIDRPYCYLSGGERQRISFAQALLSTPQLLLLDEPLSGLDLAQQEKMLALIGSVQKQMKITVLLTAHDFNPLIRYMSRLLYFAEGKAVMGTLDEIVNSQKLSELYGTPIEVFKHQHRLFVIHSASGALLYDADHFRHP